MASIGTPERKNMILEVIVSHPAMSYIHNILASFFSFFTFYITQNKTVIAILLQGITNTILVFMFPWRNESLSNIRRILFFIFNFSFSTLALSFVAAQTGNPSAFQTHWFSINYSFILILQTILNDEESPFA